VGTLTPEGWPYIVPVWYVYDGRVFTILARPKNRWVDYIDRDPRVSLCIDTVEAPYTRVLIKGTAEIIDRQWIGPWKALAIRYLGAEDGQVLMKNRTVQTFQIRKAEVSIFTSLIYQTRSVYHGYL